MMIRCLPTPSCMNGPTGTIRAQQPRIAALRPLHTPLRNIKSYNASRQAVVVQAAAAGSGYSDRSAHSEEAILKLTDTLRLLETERDEAVKTAESCARTAVKLDEMTRLLEKLALDKVAEGDETGAREVLKEKAAVSEILSRTSTRAQTNFSLASKLAQKIGQQQAELMTLLAGPGAPSSSSSSTVSSSSSSRSVAPEAPSWVDPLANAYSRAALTDSPAFTPSGSSSSSSATGSSSSATSSSSRYEAPWEKSLAEARARIKQAEEEAAAAAAAAGRSSASWAARSSRETLDEARDRLRSEAWQSVSAARSRIRQSATESIEQARARIAAEDAAVLAQVHKLIDRYKAGGYVPEEDLDWAFSQLERRSWRG